MRDWIPVPGSARARLLHAAIEVFEEQGYDAAAVVDIAARAAVTTGSLYHHFESKNGLFQVVRQELERRVRDRMEGAAEATASGGRAAVTAALLVGFDAAVKLRALRILSDAPPGPEERTLNDAIRAIANDAPPSTAAVLLGAWRAALASAARTKDPTEARAALEWLLD